MDKQKPKLLESVLAIKNMHSDSDIDASVRWGAKWRELHNDNKQQQDQRGRLASSRRQKNTPGIDESTNSTQPSICLAVLYSVMTFLLRMVIHKSETFSSTHNQPMSASDNVNANLFTRIVFH